MGKQHLWQEPARARKRRTAQQALPYAVRREDEAAGNDRADNQRGLHGSDLHHFVIDNLGLIQNPTRTGDRISPIFYRRFGECVSVVGKFGSNNWRGSTSAGRGSASFSKGGKAFRRVEPLSNSMILLFWEYSSMISKFLITS